MDKSYSQIAFDFVSETPLDAVEPVTNRLQAPEADKAEQPSVNVGVRLKALKQVISLIEPLPEAEVMELTPEISAPSAKKVVAAKSGRGRKSIRQTEAEADLIEIPEDEVLFLKQYYSMGEVAAMFRVNHSLLRFWENEFDIIQPRKNRKGDRHFRPVDIKNLHLIYHLLRQRKYTIEGAKDFLKKNKKAEAHFEAVKKLQQIRGFLMELKAAL